MPETVLTLDKRLERLYASLQARLEQSEGIQERVKLERMCLVTDILFEAARSTAPESISYKVNLGARIPKGHANEFQLREIINTDPSNPSAEDMALCNYIKNIGYNDQQIPPLPKAIENFCSALRGQLKSYDITR